MLPKDQTFSCPTVYGIVPPKKKKYVSVFYHPKTLDARNIDYVTVMPAGCASQTLLKVVGFCRGTGNPRMLQFSGDRSSPCLCLGLGNAPCLLRAGCLLALQPLCLLPPGGLSEESVEDTWRSWACPHSVGTCRSAEAAGLPVFPAWPSVSRHHHLPSVGPFLRHPWGRLIVQPHPGWQGPLTGTPSPVPRS